MLEVASNCHPTQQLKAENDCQCAGWLILYFGQNHRLSVFHHVEAESGAKHKLFPRPFSGGKRSERGADISCLSTARIRNARIFDLSLS
jgi:hypothetical protein